MASAPSINYASNIKIDYFYVIPKLHNALSCPSCSVPCATVNTDPPRDRSDDRYEVTAQISRPSNQVYRGTMERPADAIDIPKRAQDWTHA